MEQSAGAILKIDTQGRVQTPPARRESLLDEFAKSGLSAKQFAELSGIKYPTLANWLQKRRRQGQPSVPPADTVKWLEAMVEQAQNPLAQSAASVVLRLPGGAQLELCEVKQLPLAAALVRALGQPC